MRIIESIANIGIEAVKRNIGNSINEAKVKARLKEYVERNQKANWNVTLDEEVDFEGLAGYICSEMMDDVKLRFWGDRDEREAARKRIADKAVTYASAKTKLSDQRARKLVFGAIDILAKFFRDRANKDLRFFATEIEETVIEENEKTKEFIADKIDKLNQINSDSLSVDRAIKQIGEDQTEEVGKDIKTYLNAISAKHVLFPDYGFRMTPENEMISFPLTEEAKSKYPVNFQISASNVKLGDKPVQEVNNMILEQAYRHQIPITIDIQNACKLLGNVKDPIQREANKMKGMHAILTPPEFPPAFPCCVIADNEIIVPYLLLRTKEILDDGSVVLTNKEQENYNYDITILLDFSKHTTELTISIRNPSNHDYLKSLLCQRRLLTGKCITLHALSINFDLINGCLGCAETKEIDTRIDLFQRIVEIEEYFSQSIATPKSISVEEQRKIFYLSELIKDGFCSSEDEFFMEFELTEHLRRLISEAKETDCQVIGEYTGELSIFEHTILVSFYRVYVCVRVKDLCKLKEKASVLDIGDQIKITFIPGENCDNCSFIDRLAPKGQVTTAEEAQ